MLSAGDDTMALLFLLLIVALGLMAIKSTKPFASEDWQNRREYERFLRERGKWQTGCFWSVP
jgi:nitrate reductase gamma subunit